MKKTILALVALLLAILAARLAYPVYTQWKQQRFLTQAQKAFAQADFHNAAFDVRKILEINPANLEACRLMAQIAEQLKDPQAIAWRTRVVEQQPEAASNRLELARTSLHFGNIAAAERALGGIKPADATVDFHLLFAMAESAQNNLIAAEEHCAQAVRLDPTNTLAQLNLAVLQMQSTDSNVYESAVKTLEKLSSNRMHGPDALRNLTTAALKRNDFAQADKYSTELLAGTPLFTDRLLRLDVLKKSNSSEFENYLSSLENLAAHDAHNINLLGKWLRAHGLSDEAVAWLLHQPEKIRVNRSLTELLAECYADRGDWPQVETLLTAAQWQDLEFVRFALLANAHRQLNEKYNAQSDWQAALNAASGKLKPLQDLLAMTTLWHWQAEQEEAAWKIIEQFPAESSMLGRLEKIYLATHNTHGLQKVYAAMMKYSSANPAAKNNFAAVSLLLNLRVNEACDIARADYEQNPNDPLLASTLAYALHVQGRTGDGLKILEKLTDAELQNPAVATYYGVLLSAAGQTRKALPYLDLAAKSAQLLPEEKNLIAEAKANLSSRN